MQDDRRIVRREILNLDRSAIMLRRAGWCSAAEVLNIVADELRVQLKGAGRDLVAV